MSCLPWWSITILKVNLSENLPRKGFDLGSTFLVAICSMKSIMDSLLVLGAIMKVAIPIKGLPTAPEAYVNNQLVDLPNLKTVNIVRYSQGKVSVTFISRWQRHNKFFRLVEPTNNYSQPTLTMSDPFYSMVKRLETTNDTQFVGLQVSSR